MESHRVEDLRNATKQALSKAYCPYSNFRVGAAIVLADGAIVGGANVENASYPAGICAERSAILTAKMTGHNLDIAAVGVTSDSDMLVSPCGVCRQFIREFASLDTPIYMWTAQNELTVRTLDELLPLSFGPDNLKSRARRESWEKV